jgi:hypothetical protein
VSLRKFTPPHAEILAGDQKVRLRALNVNDLSLLIEAHGDSLRELWDAWAAAKDAPTEASRADRLWLMLVQRFPAVTASIIAVSADEPDAEDQARALSFATQLDAVVKIARLTFEEVGGLGNFLSSLTVAVQGLGLAPSKGDDRTSQAQSSPPPVTP